MWHARCKGKQCVWDLEQEGRDSGARPKRRGKMDVVSREFKKKKKRSKKLSSFCEGIQLFSYAPTHFLIHSFEKYLRVIAIFQARVRLWGLTQ